MSESNPVFSEASSLPPPGGEAAPRRYRVFLSYSHADTKWARWLMRRLESYGVPQRLRGRPAPVGEIGARLAPVFRDRDELPTTSDLGEAVRNALRESATLVVICSPAAARSRWVHEEICTFKRLHGEHRVFAFIVSGEPKNPGAPDDCFPRALRFELGAEGELSTQPAEVVAADARSHGDGPKLAFVRLVAGLLGVGFDELRQRELQRRNRRLTLIAAAAAAGMAVTLGLALYAWRARNEAVLAGHDAQRRQDMAEDVLAFMLRDFRDELKKLGRTDLLERVGAKAMIYFNTADARDLTDTALTRQAKALTQIGDVRMEKANYREAERAFRSAYERASALAARHPEDGNMLFERAQAEFWMAYVAWKRGEMEQARNWSTRYRDSALRLVALENNAPRAQLELISAHHNLAVLEFDAGNYAAARPAFIAETAQVRQIMARRPGDVELRLKLADIGSRLGLIAERGGNYAEAIERLAESAAGTRALAAQEPGVARWRVALGDYLTLTANVEAITRRYAEAAAGYAEAKALFNALALQDPKNQQWQLRVAAVEFNEVALLLAHGAGGAAAELLRDARGTLERLAAKEPSSQAFTRLLGKAWRYEGAIRLAAGRADAAEAASRAIEFSETLFRERRGDEWVTWELAQSNLLAGRVAEAAGQHEVAQRHWRRALEIAGARADSNDWRFVDSAAQAFTLLEQTEAARPLIERLRRFGYHPLDPLAASILDVAPTSISPTENK